MLRPHRALTVLLAVLTAALAAAAPAGAVVPEAAVAGSSSKWFSGSLIQMAGQNCSVLGSPYSEVMVSGVGSYGGTGGVVKVGDQYWAALLVAIPGNPCGPGSSGVNTEVALPPGTAFDPTRSIRCFYLPRDATATDQFQEVTGQQWSAFGSTGQMCPMTPFGGTHPGTIGAGYRPLPNGAQFQVFVPVKSTQSLGGAAGQVFDWVVDATGVYENPGLSRTVAYVFPAGSGSGSTPFVYFARTPSAVPFWKSDEPNAGLRNRAEFWAQFYVAQLGGQVHFEIRRTDTNAFVGDDTLPGTGWTPNVAAGSDLVQVVATGSAAGPNGGYVPFAFDPATEFDKPMRITWKFTPNSGPLAGQTFSGSQDFRTLPGPDTDGDGVADANDACPSAKGTQADGCLPAAPPDLDGDGVFGTQDACPNTAAAGQINGCPPGTTQDPAPAAPPAPSGTTTAPGTALPSAAATPAQLLATLGAKRNARYRARALRAGVKVKVTCSATSTANLRVTVSKATGRRLGLRGTPTVVVRATGRCVKGKGVLLTLKPAKKTLSRIAKLRRPVAATLAVALSAPGATPGSARVAVRLG